MTVQPGDRVLVNRPSGAKLWATVRTVFHRMGPNDTDAFTFTENEVHRVSLHQVAFTQHLAYAVEDDIVERKTA